ncbi:MULTISPECIES: type II toxin-antitoxin system HigB family toxin [Leptospira]|uniref:type II toxin-antitoxin system HigB family toxin n=1 Tax=Leptospira TaxID=171 RepID=UPI0004748AAF|nr:MULTISPECIES: type II toxin-antitoxin system HigB family toxin [Leptospira]MCL8267638.1 type II toxin-antitoxin system HigB family toxin [Leptospira weilii]MDL5247378.1 type II toxin-antitoxin system HigB family toxin [Leptospira weilii]
MHVISKRKITEFIEQYPKSRSSLELWYKVFSKTDFDNFPHLRKVFPSTDIVQNLFVFNISGNNYRLIAAIHFNRKKVYIREILTHSEYNKGKWKV